MRAKPIAQGPVTVPGTATVANGAAINMVPELNGLMPNNTGVALINLAAAANCTIRMQRSLLGSGDTDWVTTGEFTVEAARTGAIGIEFEIGQRIRLQVLGTATGAGTAALNAVLSN